jgi:hypothetical protein
LRKIKINNNIKKQRKQILLSKNNAKTKKTTAINAAAFV